ncbi:MAG: AzlC family ABC transporter permease [Eubacteriales bacterium]|nr:AzlC family ABC transporter permease [Eubacteriales bacterium]
MGDSNQNRFLRALSAAFRHTLPVLAGFLVLGIAYGMLMLDKGYGPQWSVLMSAVAFCGSMQFVAITLLTTAFQPLEALILSLLVNARHLFYGLSMLGKYKGFGKIKGFLIYTLCDETFSIVSSVDPPEGIEPKYFYLSISLLDYLYWVFGTLIGGLLGGLMPFDMKGLDFALTALFVVLFIEQVKNGKNWILGLIGIACALLSRLVFGAENMVLPALAIILITLIAGRKKLCN